MQNQKDVTATALIPAWRSDEELRRAQVAVASSVVGDARITEEFEGDPEREAELRDILQYLGLYRRL